MNKIILLVITLGALFEEQVICQPARVRAKRLTECTFGFEQVEACASSLGSALIGVIQLDCKKTLHDALKGCLPGDSCSPSFNCVANCLGDDFCKNPTKIVTMNVPGIFYDTTVCFISCLPKAFLTAG